jgi:hypothetical protein
MWATQNHKRVPRRSGCYCVCTDHFDLPKNLKLSIHTGSDKLPYPVMHDEIKRIDTGSPRLWGPWLEEIIGMAA